MISFCMVFPVKHRQRKAAVLGYSRWVSRFFLPRNILMCSLTVCRFAVVVWLLSGLVRVRQAPHQVLFSLLLSRVLRLLRAVEAGISGRVTRVVGERDGWAGSVCRVINLPRHAAIRVTDRATQRARRTHHVQGVKTVVSERVVPPATAVGLFPPRPTLKARRRVLVHVERLTKVEVIDTAAWRDGSWGDRRSRSVRYCTNRRQLARRTWNIHSKP